MLRVGMRSHVVQCAGKYTYGSKTEAKRAARRTETNLATGRLDVYRCPHCRSWHLGHRPGKAKAAS